MKTCNKCKDDKPLEDFHKRSELSTGRVNTCKVCLKLAQEEKKKQKEQEIKHFSFF